jgi:regulatory protein
MALANVRRACMAMLARREHTRKELFDKLLRKEFDKNDIDKTLDEFAQKDLQSDARFCDAFIRMRLRQGVGPVRIEREFDKRGVAVELARHYLDEYAAAFSKAVFAVWQKKYATWPKDFKEKMKQMRFLQSRGFTTDHIQSVFKPSD